MRERCCLARNDGSRKRGGRAATALVAATLAATPASRPALAGTPVAPSCGPEGGETVRVAGVDPDLALRLPDGRRVLIAGIDPVRATPSHPALASDAQARLEAWLDGRDAVIRPLATEPDRWGRTPALVFASVGADEPPALSVAFALVDAGLARARPDPAGHGCWASLVAAEGVARLAGLGLWADPYYAVRDASGAGGWSAGMGALALVQGRVTRVGGGRSWTRLGLDGPDADFSVRLDKRVMADLARRGVGPDGLRGLRVRVRGLLDDRFGAGLDAVEADGVEVLDADPGDTGPR